MRVLHLPTSIIGHPYNLAEAEKVLGYKSLSLSVFLDKYGYKSHISMELSSKKKYKPFLKLYLNFLKSETSLIYSIFMRELLFYMLLNMDCFYSTYHFIEKNLKNL